MKIIRSASVGKSRTDIMSFLMFQSTCWSHLVLSLIYADTQWCSPRPCSRRNPTPWIKNYHINYVVSCRQVKLPEAVPLCRPCTLLPQRHMHNKKKISIIDAYKVTLDEEWWLLPRCQARLIFHRQLFSFMKMNRKDEELLFNMFTCCVRSDRAALLMRNRASLGTKWRMQLIFKRWHNISQGKRKLHICFSIFVSHYVIFLPLFWTL